MTRKKNVTIKHSYPFRYKGNIVLFIISLIIFFPLGIILGIKNGVYLKGKKYFSFSYRGSFGWLIFWTIIFFPVALVLLLLNGVDVVKEKLIALEGWRSGSLKLGLMSLCRRLRRGESNLKIR